MPKAPRPSRLRTSHATAMPPPGFPAALARLAARRLLVRRAHAPRAHSSTTPVLATLRPTVLQRGGLTLQPSPVGWLCNVARQAAHLPGSLPPSIAVRHSTRLVAACASDGGSWPSDGADDIAELAGLFERAAAHERVNGYSNVAGRQFRDFGAFMVHALARLRVFGVCDSVAWVEASEDAAQYATLRVQERSAVVVRNCYAGSLRRTHELSSQRCCLCTGALRPVAGYRSRHACAA